MKIQVLCIKTAFKLEKNIIGILTSFQRNFSILNSLRKKIEPIIVNGKDCKQKSPILKSRCKVAVVIGGSNNGFGFSAASQLLHYGAKKVVIADNNAEIGVCAVEKLCKAYGKHRAQFYFCDVKDSCHIEGIFTSSCCKNEKISIVFNDIDAIQSSSDFCLSPCLDTVKINTTQSITRISFKSMFDKMSGKHSNGIIINCASILGFVGWPDQPEPIYCSREPIIEISFDVMKDFPVKNTGIRVVSLCPTNRTLETIGLPEFPDYKMVRSNQYPNWSCAPDSSRDRGRLGKALEHIMARAESGSVWLLEPSFTLRETPRLVNYLLKKI